MTEKKQKKYKLHNSYFKVNRMLNLPDSILEIAEYEKANGELPFAYTGNNWVYDAFCERQKYRGVDNSQFLTPDNTVKQMMHFVEKYFFHKNVLEPCCGTGQITRELLKTGYDVLAFDSDSEHVRLCKLLYPDLSVFQYDFRDSPYFANQIIANPSYEISELTDFLEWIERIQGFGGIAILLLPKGFVNKKKPKRTVNALSRFEILEIEDMKEGFVRTETRAEIVVLRKL